MMLHIPGKAQVAQAPQDALPGLCSLLPNDPSCKPPDAPKTNWAALIVPPIIVGTVLYLITRRGR